jgi:hypothetical protein
VISLPPAAIFATPEIGHEGGLASGMNMFVPAGKTAAMPLASVPGMSFQSLIEDLLPGMPAMNAQDSTELSPEWGDVPGPTNEERQNRVSLPQAPKPAWHLSLPLAAGTATEGIAQLPEKEEKPESLVQANAQVAVRVVVEPPRPHMESAAAFGLPGRESPAVVLSGEQPRKERDLREDSPPAQVFDSTRLDLSATVAGMQHPPASQPVFLAPAAPVPLSDPPSRVQTVEASRSSLPSPVKSTPTAKEQARPWEAAFSLRLEGESQAGEHTVQEGVENHGIPKEASREIPKLNTTMETSFPRSTQVASGTQRSPAVLAPPTTTVTQGEASRAPERVPEQPSRLGGSSETVEHDIPKALGPNLKATPAEVTTADTPTREGQRRQSDARDATGRRPEPPNAKTVSVNSEAPGPEKRGREAKQEAPPIVHSAMAPSRPPFQETRDSKVSEVRSVTTGENPMAEATLKTETQHIAAPGRESKQITLPLDSAGMRDIEVRLVDRGGNIQVSVHSPDREVRSTLRANLQDLIGSLETHGIRAESIARAGEPSQAALSDAANARESSPMGPSELPAASGREFDASRQQQQQQRHPWLVPTDSKKPGPQDADAWQEALEASWQIPS